MKKLILIFLTLSCYNGIAQELIVNAGWSISNHSDLRAMQREYIDETGLPLEVVQNYPSYFQYSLMARFRLGQRFQLGGNVFTTSSAARSVYEDYSGIWKVDYSLRCVGFGVIGTFSLYKPTPLVSINIYAMLGWSITSLSVHEYAHLTTGVAIRDHKDQYHTASPMSETGLEYQGFFAKNFFARASIGLHITPETSLANSSSSLSDYATVSWTGVKVLVGVGYRFVRLRN